MFVKGQTSTPGGKDIGFHVCAQELWPYLGLGDGEGGGSPPLTAGVQPVLLSNGSAR